MKFLQIHCFYDWYLNEFYSQRQSLLSAPTYEDHIDALLDDGFSGSHLFAPYLKSYGYDSKLVIANCQPSQIKWALDHGVTEVGVNTWVLEIVARQIEDFQPDILYISHPIDFDSRFLRCLNWQPKLIFGWRAAAVPDSLDMTAYQVILSSDSTTRDVVLRRGAQSVRHFVPGFPEFIHQRVKDVPKEYDVMFSGQFGREHTRRNEFLRQVAVHAKNPKHPFSVNYFLATNNPSDLAPEIAEVNKGMRWGMEMHRAIKRGRIALNATIDFARGEAGNMRQFEVTGTGSFLITEANPTLQQYFEPGKEVETYSSTGELLEKVDFYLANPEKREEIARAGYARCMRDHCMSKRVAEFDQVIREELAKGDPNTRSCPKFAQVEPRDAYEVECVNGFIDQALEKLKEGHAEEALQMMIKAKGMRIAVRQLDYVRALCFVELNKLGDARESLLEELRHFPDNTDAQSLLEQVREEEAKQARAGGFRADDPEFVELMKVLRPFTMLPEIRLYSLFQLTKQVCINDIPGDFVECGVAGGGSSALMAALIKKYSRRPRKLYACDSYEGMPAPSEFDTLYGRNADDTGWGNGTCAAPEESVKKACGEVGAVEILKPIKGFFENTLPTIKSEMTEIAFMHIDCDWYQSTLTILNNLYDKVSGGGAIQVDDYGYWEGMAKAVHEFEGERKLRFDIKNIDGGSAWFVKVDH